MADIEDIAAKPVVNDQLKNFTIELANQHFETRAAYDKAFLRAKSANRIHPSKVTILEEYGRLLQTRELVPNESFERFALRKSGRSASGVLVITVLTAPGSFSCAYNCYFCPSEPQQPKSYISTEPAVARANQNNFDAVRQFYDRAHALELCGHSCDKVELLVLGGTWSSYPKDYQETYIRDLFYAANTYHELDKTAQRSRKKNQGWIASADPRPRLSLEEEQRRNEESNCRIIGLTLETRPDSIDPEEILRLRRFGCTRLQLGVQHTDNHILKKINRQCTTERVIEALKMLKNACYKIDVHLMFDLPFASPEIDREMAHRMLTDPDLSVDDWKIYPCMTTRWTVIQKWYEEGKYKPYAELEGGRLLRKLILDTMMAVPPTVRLNRVIRDIPKGEILGGVKDVNMRQYIEDDMKKQRQVCSCIRCREIKSDTFSDYHYYVREFTAQGSTEMFLSCEGFDHDKPVKNGEPNVLYGFLRLRLPKGNAPLFESLRSSALIRELHVYGHIASSVSSKTPTLTKHQSRGIGKHLMSIAERIAQLRGYSRIAVISGIGVKGYYRRLGYLDSVDGYYMTKGLTIYWPLYFVVMFFLWIWWHLFAPKGIKMPRCTL